MRTRHFDKWHFYAPPLGSISNDPLLSEVVVIPHNVYMYMYFSSSTIRWFYVSPSGIMIVDASPQMTQHYISGQSLNNMQLLLHHAHTSTKCVYYFLVPTPNSKLHLCVIWKISLLCGYRTIQLSECREPEVYDRLVFFLLFGGEGVLYKWHIRGCLPWTNIYCVRICSYNSFSWYVVELNSSFICIYLPRTFNRYW